MAERLKVVVFDDDPTGSQTVHGAPLLLQSRAHDSTGYVQPTKDQLRSVRGLNSIYHNNGIQTWAVNSDGVAENVEIS